MIYDAESEGPLWAGERRGDTYGLTMERPGQSSSSHQAQSETELGRKSQEQFVTVASPALPMQNWHQLGQAAQQLWLAVWEHWEQLTNPGPHIYH